jgi:hypothetical protein
MAEPLTVNVNKREFGELYRRAAAGDETARDTIRQMWAGHEDETISCFICPSTDTHPVHMLLLPEREADNPNLLAVAICRACREQPIMMIMGRALRTLRRMWGTKAFYFTPAQRHHPAR